VAILSYVIDVGRMILLFMLDILGPFCLAFGVLPATDRIAFGWALRWIEICLWSVIYGAFIFAITTAYAAIIAIVPTKALLLQIATSIVQGKCELLAMFLAIVLGIVSIFMLLSVPAMASTIVAGRSAGFYRGVVVATGLIPTMMRSYITRSVKGIGK
ncbi:MAG: hypothetical protein L0287_15290, partial [Anaerolineae bacterium]|nr:hypothetical protein [Anaerolineae bacterium]